MAQAMRVAGLPNVNAAQIDVFKSLAGNSDDTGSIKKVCYVSTKNAL